MGLAMWPLPLFKLELLVSIQFSTKNNGCSKEAPDCICADVPEVYIIGQYLNMQHLTPNWWRLILFAICEIQYSLVCILYFKITNKMIMSILIYFQILYN